MKICVVFNICGISGRENVQSYIESLNSILAQDFDDFSVVVSSCRSSAFVKTKLWYEFGDRVTFNFIEEMWPVNVTFNHSVRKYSENFGPAEAYLYVDSGVTFDDQKDILSRLYELHKSGPYGMTAGRTDTDAGTWQWFQKGRDQHDESGQSELFKDGHLVIPVGKTINLHFQLFDRAIFDNYGGCILPDIFASHCTESTFSFVNAAIGRKFIVHKDIVVRHYTSMDGASSGFRPEYVSVPPWQHLLDIAPVPILSMIADPEAKECGFGYEECQHILMHDDTQFDENGYAKQPERLRKFILENIFLGKALDYSKIRHEFVRPEVKISEQRSSDTV